jgi:hypothetical protein
MVLKNISSQRNKNYVHDAHWKEIVRNDSPLIEMKLGLNKDDGDLITWRDT